MSDQGHNKLWEQRDFIVELIREAQYHDRDEVMLPDGTTWGECLDYQLEQLEIVDGRLQG